MSVVKPPYPGAHMRRCQLILMLILGVAPLEAQWRVGAGLGKEDARGFTRGVGANADQSLLPYRPMIWALRVETPGVRLRAAVELRYATPDLALRGPDLTVVAHEGITTVVGLRPAAAFDVARLSEHVVIRAEVGPLFEIWSFEDEDARTRVSAEGGLGLAVELGGRMAALVTGTGSVMPSSPFKGTLMEDLEPCAGWRWGLRGMVMYRL